MGLFFGTAVETEDGSITIRHPLFDEEFHAVQGARFETEALYRDGSGLPHALSHSDHDLTILDVGLGLGYNALMTLETWWLSPGCVSLTLLSLEISPELIASLRDPICVWKKDWSQEWRTWSEQLPPLDAESRTELRLTHPQSGKTLLWTVQVGPAEKASFAGFHFDFVWQDAFSPKKNPELWNHAWFAKLKDASRPDVCLVTYSVARIVKDSLLEAGWTFEKFRMPNHKKEWLRARLKTT